MLCAFNVTPKTAFIATTEKYHSAASLLNMMPLQTFGRENYCNVRYDECL